MKGVVILINDFDRFCDLRVRLFRLIQKELNNENGCHKSYEGSLTIGFPSIFGGSYFIHLNCCALGNFRHHTWKDKTLRGAINKFEETIFDWKQDDQEN